MSHLNRTLLLIKPDGVERGIVGKIMTMLEDRGLKIIGLKMVKPSTELANTHYGDLDERLTKKGMDGPTIKDQMVKYLTAGPVVAMVIEGVRAVEYVKKLAGSTAPHEAELGTIRGMFAHMSRQHANEAGRALTNLVHASDPEEAPETEISLWFSPAELVEYQTVHDPHVL
jgi:nucleoside-diphosphate kinase